MMRFSVIIPVYNRPDEVDELLNSLSECQEPQMEVIIVDDGSADTCEECTGKYGSRLDIRYYFKENSGQGFTRNWAAEKAQGEYLVFFDSDCLIPSDYFGHIRSRLDNVAPDAWGGPDRAHPDFTLLQKATGFTMSSVLTTGGIRGKKIHTGQFQPRTFNMGIRSQVFRDLGGFGQTNMGEDIELSTRMLAAGYRSELIHEAFVYHKRRESLKGFFRQVMRFGRSRVMNFRKNRGGLGITHLFPVLFLLGLLGLPVAYSLGFDAVSRIFSALYIIYFLCVAIAATAEYRSLFVGILAVPVTIVQFAGYGLGILRELLVPGPK